MERKSHQCPNCNKSFSSSHQLAQHVRIHSNEKPYKCSVCEKSFKQLSHVQAHTRLHTGERPYHCSVDGCGRTFIQLSNLQQHQKTHSNGLEKAERSEKRNANSQNCPVCTKAYINGASLRRHIQTTHADFLEGNSSAITITDSDSQSSSTNVQQVNFVLSAADLKALKGQKVTQLITSDGESSVPHVFLIDSINGINSINSDTNVFVTSLTPKLLSRTGSNKKH